ncbi:MAG: MBL fold metallo-hydrolase [Acidimicrobiia bacterium]|nr:MBL fold metallo-hydrolase [Acidimicrobiia bacterium]
MALSVTVLGCSGTYAAAGGACTGFFVADDATDVWLDAGPGTLGNLQLRVPLADLDAIVITHEHPDHWLELPVVANALRHYLHDVDDIPLYAPAPTLAVIETMCRTHDGSPAPFEPHEVADGDQVRIGTQRWSFSRTDHYVETLAVRVVADGRSLAFSADTGPGWSFSEFGEPIDLALGESTFLDRADHEGVLHMSAGEAGDLARRAGVQRLVLTHIQPGDDPAAHAATAAATFGGPVDVASVGATYTP